MKLQRPKVWEDIVELPPHDDENTHWESRDDRWYTLSFLTQMEDLVLEILGRLHEEFPQKCQVRPLTFRDGIRIDVLLPIDAPTNWLDKSEFERWWITNAWRANGKIVVDRGYLNEDRGWLDKEQ